MLLFITGFDATHVGLDPDLQKVRGLVRQRIELAVHHTATGAHALYVTGPDGRSSTRRILVRKRAIEHIADDLHVLMAVRAEALAGSDAIFVDHAQRTELDVLRIEV